MKRRRKKRETARERKVPKLVAAQAGQKKTRFLNANLPVGNALPMNAAPGSTWKTSHGRRYQLQADGSWRRLE